MNDYQKHMETDQSAAVVYAALTEHIQHWWSTDLTGAAAQAGDSFTIGFGETRKTFKILEATPCTRVVWTCTKAYIDLNSLQNKGEWVGTRLVWTLDDRGENTTLTFLHEGLSPDLECYTVCEDGWNTFLASLGDYLATGKGAPFLKV
ncbi:hypothetical protein DYBT9275_01432 [Dyadobacter sp. CECT 9275]|uniref:Activator of Hsp90 ATPase homologue 1/2-like C-terminal domain-containing protein n=1 Tax=Dyadobacter helix TaxID=2822344 RepID=A0A916J8X6_9BACT|nr:SRPBCC domain-containing protein [Dyadobacter sp. CECT 9275]CAG4994626.1 hypothetical protein DYBT9275_01432 [Dyadobacter sp. CECT 9275]